MKHKLAQTQQPIHRLLAERWSPRAFDSDKPLTQDTLASLLEAARWAPSCFNDQPWRFVVFNRHVDENAWQRALSLLTEKNQLWARSAPVLILVCADGQFGHNGNANRWAQYDAGAASLSLCLQATTLGLVTHQMGGFDIESARTLLGIPESVTPMVMMAVGHAGEIKKLHSDFVATEQSARERKPLGAFVFENRWA